MSTPLKTILLLQIILLACGDELTAENYSLVMSTQLTTIILLQIILLACGDEHNAEIYSFIADHPAGMR